MLRDTITTTIDGVTTTQTLDFRYDESGHPYELIRTVGETTTSYYYITNLQGDVMHLVDGDGTAVASYTYDPYGNILTATGDLAEVNPLRYRGYYYDGETGIYYVSSRYYDSEIRRFVNADVFVSTGQSFLGYNMFAYCRNNPICRRDISGTADVEIFDDDPDLLDDDKVFAGGKTGGKSGLLGKGFDGGHKSGSSSTPKTLYHYTNEKGMTGIVETKKLNPSLKANNPNDCFYGEGQYLSDIVPGTKSPAQLSRSFIYNPFQGAKYAYYVEIDVTDLDVVYGRDNVFVIFNQESLDLMNRIVSYGKVGD